MTWMVLGVTACTTTQAEQTHKLVVPFPAGGAMDKVARAIAGALQESAAVKLIIDNRPGADGLIAVEHILQSGESASSILMVNPYFTIARANGRLPSARASRFKPLVQIGQLEIALIASKRSGVQSIADITSGVTSGRQLACAAAAGQFTMICDRLARDYPRSLTSVPYKGEAQALNDLIGGHVDLMPVTRISADPHIKSDTVALVANLARPPSAKITAEVPSIFRMPLRSFMGLMVTDEMPGAVAQRLHAEINKILRSPGFQATVGSLGIQVVGGSEGEFDRFLQDNAAVQASLIRDDSRP